MSGGRRQPARQRGAGAVEYLGVVAAVGVLLVGLTAVGEHRVARRPPVDPLPQITQLLRAPPVARAPRARPVAPSPRPRPRAKRPRPRATVTVPRWVIAPPAGRTR